MLVDYSVVRVGMELANPPFAMIDTEGKPAGLNVDLAHAFGRYINRKIEIENIPFVGLIPSLKGSKIDLIISSMSVTEEREKSIDFSDPYIQIGLALLVGKESTIQNIQGVDEKGRVVLVKIGTSGERYACDQIKKAEIRALETESACVLEVIQGKGDAFIYDQASIYTFWKNHSNSTRALLNPFYVEPWAIGMRKGSDLKEQVNRFLKAFRKEGGFEELEDRYFKEQKAAFKEMGIPFFF